MPGRTPGGSRVEKQAGLWAAGEARTMRISTMRISGVALSTIASLFLVCAGCASDVESEENLQVDQFYAAVPASRGTSVEENPTAPMSLNLVDRQIIGHEAVIEFYDPKPGAPLVSVARLAGGLFTDTLGRP